MKITAIHPRMHDILRARHIARLALSLDSSELVSAANILRSSADAEDHDLADALIRLMIDNARPVSADVSGEMAEVDATRARVRDKVRAIIAGNRPGRAG